jgi:hypothetical protein
LDWKCCIAQIWCAATKNQPTRYFQAVKPKNLNISAPEKVHLMRDLIVKLDRSSLNLSIRKRFFESRPMMRAVSDPAPVAAPASAKPVADEMILAAIS